MREYPAIAGRVAADRPRGLDWGAGHGQVTQVLLEHGLDVVPFEYRGGLDGDGVEPLSRDPSIDLYVSGDPVKLPFEDVSFDAVLSVGVLAPASQPGASLDELRRVLETGGTLYVYKFRTAIRTSSDWRGCSASLPGSETGRTPCTRNARQLTYSTLTASTFARLGGRTCCR